MSEETLNPFASNPPSVADPFNQPMEPVSKEEESKVVITDPNEVKLRWIRKVLVDNGMKDVNVKKAAVALLGLLQSDL